MDLTFGVVPVEIQTEVAFSFPILGNIIVLFEDGHEMVSVLFASVLDAKIVHA